MESIVSYHSSDSTQSTPVKSPAPPAATLTPVVREDPNCDCAVFAAEEDKTEAFAAGDKQVLAVCAEVPGDKLAGMEQERECNSKPSEEPKTEARDTATANLTAADASEENKDCHSPELAMVRARAGTAAGPEGNGAAAKGKRRRPRTTTGNDELPPSKRNYYVRYQGNSSKRWDGKQIVVDGETLESLYPVEELVPGKDVVIPWPKKGGEIENWKGVLVDPSQSGRYPCVHGYLASYTAFLCVAVSLVAFLA